MKSFYWLFCLDNFFDDLLLANLVILYWCKELWIYLRGKRSFFKRNIQHFFYDSIKRKGTEDLVFCNLLLTKIEKEMFVLHSFDIHFNFIFFNHHLNCVIIVGKFTFKQIIESYSKTPNIRFCVIFTDVNLWSFWKDISNVQSNATRTQSLFGQSEVCEFEKIVFEKNVLWFNVSMENLFFLK